MTEQQYREVKSDLTAALTRLDAVESRMGPLEESINRAVETLMPKVDSVLSERAQGHPSESTSSLPSAPPLPSASEHLPLPASVLSLAERGDGEALLQLLTARQVDVRSNPPRTDDGDTALHVAASAGHLKAVVVLLGMGARADAAGHRLRTPLHCAVAHGHLAVARRLLDMRAKLDVKDADGTTALGLAAGRGSDELVLLLLKEGARPDQNSVSTAAENGHWNLVELLLQNGEDLVNACNKDGHFLIVLAAKANRWEMVDLLLKKGATATQFTDPKESALVYASWGGQADIVRELLRRGAAADVTQMERAITRAQNAAIVWAFVELAPARLREHLGKMGLVSAARDGRHNALVAFLDSGVDVDGKDGRNVCALNLAASNGRTDCVRELLQRGADPNASDVDGNTPLHAATCKGHSECVDVLLDAGASISAQNKLGKTPLDTAVSGMRVTVTME